MMNRNCFFTLASSNNAKQPGVRPLTDKIGRFNLVVPWFKTGKMFYPEQLRTNSVVAAHIEEITMATMLGFKTKHDDCADTVSMLPLIGAWRPGEAVSMVQQDNGVWAPEETEEEATGYGSYVV